MSPPGLLPRARRSSASSEAYPGPQGSETPTEVFLPPSRMAEGLPQQTLVGQRYRTPLSAKVFSSWDFCIRVWEAATIKKHEISNELKVREAERAPKHTCVC